MATVLGSIYETDPVGVAGTFDGKDVRNALIGNTIPGLFAAGDFAISQRAAGANMSVDMAQGRAFLDPQASTHQGLYFTRRTNATAYNSSVDGGITIPAADATNPRIDLWCLALNDTTEDASGSTGARLALVTGTASASATHQLEANVWPAIPTGYLPIAAVRVPATATTITTTNITNLNPIAGGRASTAYTPGVESLVGATAYGRFATPDAALVYVPSTSSVVRLAFSGQIKKSAATGNVAVRVNIDGAAGGAPSNGGGSSALNVLLSAATTTLFYAKYYSSVGTAAASYGAMDVPIADSTESLPGIAGGYAAGGAQSPITLHGLSAGWRLVELKYNNSDATTMSTRLRHMQVEVVG